MDGNMAMILGIIAVVFVVVCVFLSFVPLGLWISALSSGVHVSMGALIGMKIRHIKPHRLVQPLIKANKAGLGLNISQLETHKQVLENPDLISRTVLSKGLDAGTAYEILSIDIADVDVGRNIGAQLMMDQAESDRRVAQAKAEERRAMAVAHEQEMKAAVQEMRAKVVEAEAEVPKAMAAALREGKLGVMDYYQMQNTIADTSMRDSIAKASAPQSTPTHSLEKK